MSNESNQREFLAEIEVMDLSPIKNETFAVAISTGNPDSVKFLCSTIHGPYNFVEMCEEVGNMWVKHQYHAKVIILDKDPNSVVRCLDENTVDYIEAHYESIIFDETLANFRDDSEYTCVAGTIDKKDISEAR